MLKDTYTRSPWTASPTLSVQDSLMSTFAGTAAFHVSPKSSDRCTIVSLSWRYATKTLPAPFTATWRSIWYELDTGFRGLGAPNVRPPSWDTWIIAIGLGQLSQPTTSPKWAHATYTFPFPSAATSGSQSSPPVKPIRTGIENVVLAATPFDRETARIANPRASA